MPISLKKLGLPVAGIGLFTLCGVAIAADTTGRAAYNVMQLNRAGTQTPQTQRMPTMPTLPVTGVGNLSPNLPAGGDNGGGDPSDPVDPEPTPECPDGGVKDSEYTVEDCMNDILACINNGALSGGLNDLFNEDLRNAIVNGMGLCATQVERCVADVRKIVKCL